TDAQILQMIGSGSQMTQTDRDLFTKTANGLTHGNHVATVVTYEMTGRYNIQRFPGLFTSTVFGAGPGDLNFDGAVDATDLQLFRNLLASNNTQFNPAADLNGDGLIDNSDLVLLWQRLLDLGVDPDVLAAYQQIVGPPAAGYTIRVGDAVTLLVSLPPSSTPPLTFDWDLNGDGAFGDVS